MRFIVFLLSFNLVAQALFAQNEGLVFRSSKDSSFWLRATGAIQVWTRYTDHNPGTALSYGSGTVYRDPSQFDIGIRRARFQIFGNVNKRTFIYAQFGINNFSSISQRKAGAFFHDLTAEYVLVPGGYLSTGGGLTGWSGLSRYSAPSIASTLMYDAPLFQQTTNDVSDQFLRKLSLYAKGKAGAFDYRVALSKPMPVQQATGIDTSLGPARNQANFSPRPPALQLQSYLMWQFLDRESNQLPYTVGSYLGSRRVLNLGGGIIWQPDAMRYLGADGTERHTAMRLAAIDVFFDHPLNREKQTAITAYFGYFNLDFGPNHIRTLGVMNPANASVDPIVRRYSGFGNAFAMFGTGEVLYLQGGYKFRNNLFGDLGTIQPYADIMYGSYEAFRSPMIVWNAGFNWLISNHNSKVSLNFQERPVFVLDPLSMMGEELRSARRGMLVLQYQAFF